MERRKIIRFFAGFTLAVALIIGVGSATYLTLRKQEAEQKNVQHTYKVLGQANYLQQLLIDMETGRRGFRCTGDKKFLEPYYASQPKLQGAVAQLAALVQDNPKQVAKVEELKVSTQKIDDFWKSININIVYRDQEEKTRVTQFEKVCMDDVRLHMTAIEKEEKDLLAIREIETGKGLKQTITTIIVGDIMVLLIVGSLIWLSLSEYSIRSKAEKKLSEKLDELKRLNDETNKKNWQLSGIREINSSLMGHDNLQKLIDGSLQKIVEFTKAPVGAFYFYDEYKKNLKLVGKQGVPAGVAEVIQINEGITGKAATSRNVSVIDNIPKGYWQISSATGSAAPSTLICTPLWLNDEIAGIIEIATFARNGEEITGLMAQVADNIATAIKAADANDKLQILLGKVQEQKEELESQQEELRQTNEELTRQSEILRASEEELKTQEEELRNTNAELEMKTEAVEATSKELEHKASELEQSSKYKSQFLANMSHELRTPLNSVMILANLLKQNKHKNLDDKQVEYARTIHKSGGDLLSLINDILDLTKIEAGKIDIYIEQVKIKELAGDMDQLFTAVSKDKKVGFAINMPEDLPEYITTDKQRLEQIMRNLLSNAFKFTPEHGTVTLTFEGRGNILSISVKDTGIGIPADKQKLIFEAFQQADGSTSRKYGGTGLGLAISKELAHKLQGEVYVTSEAGAGSTFTIVVPFDGSQAATNNYVHNTTEKEVIAYSLDAVKEQTAVPDDRIKVKSGEQHILIIEDDLVFAGIVNNYAHTRGYKTIVATKGDEGVLYAKTYKPMAIILDLGLPVIDGRSILKILKADPALNNIPVHVITAEDRTDMPNAKIDSYFQKPLQADDLEHAFGHIETYLKANYKNILLLSPGRGRLVDMFDTLTKQKNTGIIYHSTDNTDDAKKLLEEKTPDCIIADISTDINEGILTVKELKKLAPQGTYIITCLDSDISAADERELKQYSDSIIRKSPLAADRLLDEVELFLHKLKTTKKVSVPEQYAQVMDSALSGKKVLLADDDMRNVFALSAALEEQGMKIVTAEDGKVAIDMMKQHSDIDIVLMDVMMPEIDGFEAIKQIRAMSQYKNKPIIALTAKSSTQDKEKCIEAGASDYISKPVENNKLFSLMRVWLS